MSEKKQGEPIVIVYDNPRAGSAAAVQATHSCAVRGHRFAYLNAGGVECVRCGARG